MATLIWCACLLLLADLTSGARDINVDHLAEQQSDLVRQTFNVIEDAIAAQYEMFDVRIKGLEARIEDLERVISEGDFGPRPVDPVEPSNPKPVKPKPEPVQPEPVQPEPVQPEPEPEPVPTTTTRAPTTVRTTTTTEAPVALAPPQSCQEIFDRGETASGTYSIDPKGLGWPFDVQCNMIDGAVETVVGHDSESEQRNNGNKAAGSYVLTPTYTADMEQLAALIDISGSCQQFIKLRCKLAVLFEKKGVDYGWWLSRDGEVMRSWGGVEASTTSRKCACTTTNDCTSGKLCHCDAASKSEKSDEGLLTDKEYLPVSAVHLGDTGGKKQTSWLTLGSLVCTGAV